MAVTRVEALHQPVEDRWDYLIQPGRIHRTLYTDPEIFDLEMRKVFGGTWMYLAHDTEIPEPHDFVTRRMGLRPIIVTRDKTGQVHGLKSIAVRIAAPRSAVKTRDARNISPAAITAGPMTGPANAWVYRKPRPMGRASRWPTSGWQTVPRIDTYRGFVFGHIESRHAAPA